MINLNFDLLNKKIAETNFTYSEGIVKKVIGLTVEVEGIKSFVGEVCTIYNEKNTAIPCEVVGFKHDNVILMPLGELIGIAPGCRVVPEGKPLSIKCSDELFGKVLDGIGNPLEGELSLGGTLYSLDTEPPDPLKRRRIKNVIPTGIRAIDGFITCGEGQRIGIFAGSQKYNSWNDCKICRGRC